ncbi:MAG: ABC transporter permease [Vicinamibacterales bacterium]|nr:ABC transporter permease [Vicinamibacterales bacterium]
MSAILKDLRFGLRVLAKNPGFTVVAILVLGLGIGANAAVFSVVNAVLLRPLPGVDSGTPVLGLYNKDTTRPGRYRPFSYPNYVDIREASTAFSSIAACNLSLAGITEGDTTRRAFVLAVSANYFDTLGGRPARGRVFTPDEERPGQPATVAIASDAYWRKAGADPDLVGDSVVINSRIFTIVGIAPPGFTGNSPMVGPEFWVPLSATALVMNDFMNERPGSAADSRSAQTLLVVGRLRAGATRETVDRELAQIGSRLADTFPAENADYTIVSAAMPRTGLSTSPSDDGGAFTMSAVLMAMSAVVLLVACLNLANMLLARGTARRREIAIRISVGASRSAVVRQLLVEGLLLAIGGGALGLFLAQGATTAFVQSMVPMMPVPLSITTSPDWRVVSVTLLFSVLATLAFALGPAWRITRPGVLEDLKEQRAVAQHGRRARLLGARNLLLVSQMALSLALLVAGALFVRGAMKAADATPGFPFERGLIVEVDPSLAAYTPEQAAAAHRGLLAHIRTIPGVEAASMASVVPFGAISEGTRVARVSGADGPGAGSPAEAPVSAGFTVISTDYFRSLDLAVVRGREFTPGEAEGEEVRRVAIIDEPLAQRLFPGPGDNPVGQYVRLVVREGQREEPLEVVGVVRGVRDNLFERAASPHVYLPFPARTRSWMNYHIRTAGGDAAAAAMVQTIRREIRTVDERLPVLAVNTLQGFGERSLFLWIFRSAARIFSAFGLAALLLAVVGIYGVNAYLVARRTREIGIRMALGATAADVVRLIVRDAAVVAAIGVGIGLGLAVALGSLLSSMLYEVRATDPLALLAAPLLLGGSALLASYIPARRATRVAPVEALRQE